MEEMKEVKENSHAEVKSEEKKEEKKEEKLKENGINANTIEEAVDKKI